MYTTRGFRIRLTGHQARLVSQIRTAQRYAYNWAIERLKTDPALTLFDLRKEFRRARNTAPYLREISIQYQMAAIRQARTACDVSNKYGRGNLNFRSRKRGGRTSVECVEAPKYTGNASTMLPGLGNVELLEEQPYAWPHNWLHGARSFRLMDITPRRWRRVALRDRVCRLYVTYKLDKPKLRTGGLAVGIDRGITNPTTVARSDGSVTCYDTASVFRDNAHAADKERRKLSKASARSRRHAKRVARQAARRRDWANVRDYTEWMLAKEICEGASVVCFERLYLEAMTRHGGRRKRGLNRAMRFVRHAEVRRKVEVVAARLGIRVVDVDPRHTSQQCNMCSHTDGENRHGERFECLGCGHVDNADGNAARNILCRGTGIKVLAGEGIALERRELGRTRNPPIWVHAAPDARWRRERQARNRSLKSAGKHLGRYAYVTLTDSGI